MVSAKLVQVIGRCLKATSHYLNRCVIQRNGAQGWTLVRYWLRFNRLILKSAFYNVMIILPMQDILFKSKCCHNDILRIPPPSVISYVFVCGRILPCFKGTFLKEKWHHSRMKIITKVPFNMGLWLHILDCICGIRLIASFYRITGIINKWTSIVWIARGIWCRWSYHEEYGYMNCTITVRAEGLNTF